VDYPRRIDGPLRAWQAEWSGYGELTDRMVGAVRSSTLAVESLQEYSRAYRRDLNSHVDGVTVVAIARLLDHLQTVTGLEPAPSDIGDIFDIIPAVRLAAQVALERGEYLGAAHATLGELYLVSGDQAAELQRQEALAHYQIAGAFPAERDIMLERLHFFAALGFRPVLVSAAISALEAKPE
jgi:hypothetical protein